ncbi:restriction endonuclease subunit S [Vibrio hyugaensis]
MSLDQAPINQLITDNIDTWTSTVKTKATTGRGSSKKLELYGVKKLRELILELAVRGKLVPQDPTDDPASVLLERIANEKAQLVKDKKIKKLKKLPSLTKEDCPFELPDGWAFSQLANLSYVITKGTTPTSVGYDFTSSGVNFVKVENIDRESITNSAISQYISYETNDALARSSLDEGDILFSIAGTIGKTCLVKKSDLPANTNQALAIIKGTSTVFTPKFLLLQLGSFVSKKTRDKARGGAMPNVSLGDLSELVTIVPPMTHQHRIVAKVDELMTLCDQLEQQTEASIAAHQVLVTTLLDTLTNSANAEELMQNWQMVAEHFDTLFTTEESIDQLKQTILQLAVMGKLVPQDPNDELQPNDLVTVVKKQRTISSLAKNTGKVDLNTFEFFSEKLALPSNWTVHPLAEIVLAVVDCPHSTPKWTDNGEICVRTTQMAPFSLDLSTSRYVSSDTYLKRIERLKPESDDVLYSREGGILGVACRVPSGVELCLGQRMIVIRPSRLITSRFLELVLNSPLVNEIARHNTTGGAAPRVNVNVIKGYPTPLPPLEEQNRIITKVDELFSVCDALKVRLKDSQTTQLHLTDAIVEQAV